MTKDEFEEIYKNNKEGMDKWFRNYVYACQTKEDLINSIKVREKNSELGEEMAERYKLVCRCGFLRIHGEIKCENCGLPY